MSTNNKVTILILAFVFIGAFGIILFKEKITVNPPKISTENLIPNLKKEPKYTDYAGILPCADCTGIQTTLRLYEIPKDASSGAYKLTEVYVDRDPDPVVQEGDYVIQSSEVNNKVNEKIILSPEDELKIRQFLIVGPGEIKMLDKNGNEINSTLNYTLLTDSQE